MKNTIRELEQEMEALTRKKERTRAQITRMWPTANAASVYTITAAIMNKELKI